MIQREVCCNFASLSALSFPKNQAFLFFLVRAVFILNAVALEDYCFFNLSTLLSITILGYISKKNEIFFFNTVCLGYHYYEVPLDSDHHCPWSQRPMAGSLRTEWPDMHMPPPATFACTI